jgi:acetoin utilization protein AcuB
MLVAAHMSAEVYSVAPTASIGEALGITRAQRIRHLPVLEDGLLVGLVTERDLRLAAPPAWTTDGAELRATLSTKKVSEVMVSHVITTAPATPIEAAAKLLYENKIGCLPIVEDDRLVGILTESDLLRALVEVFGAAHPLARLEIRMPNRPGELARVVRVIGIEHRINISGLIVPPTGHDSLSTAIIQLHTTDPLPVIEALRRLGYTVGWPAIELDPDALPEEVTELAAQRSLHHGRVPLEL